MELVYIADGNNNRIRKVTPNGIITTVAGNGTAGYSGDGGKATSAELSTPIGVTVDTVGNVYIADFDSSRIRKIATNGIISTVAGNGISGYSGDGGAATAAELLNPRGVAVDIVGSIYIADAFSNVVRKVATNGVITTVAGNGTFSYSGDGGKATEAALAGPSSVAIDSAGNIYIADGSNNRIRKVATNGIINTVAGNGMQGYSGDGGAAKLAEICATAVKVDAAGNIYIADFCNNRIRKVATNGIISTVAGNGHGEGTLTGGYSGDGGSATAAELALPTDIALDTAGNIYIADYGNNVIRKVTGIGNLPIFLSSFTAATSKNIIQTNWHTSTELNTSDFVIQHSTDGNSFTDIGIVKAVGNGANSYGFTDNNPANGINYYRLESVDKDGASTYSAVVSVQFTVNSNQLKVYPNPARSTVTIRGNHIASVQLIDNMGRVVKVVSLKAATNPTLPVSNLQAGVYHLRVQTSDGNVSGVGFVTE